jgi:type IV secretory pathway VirB6-like protein
MGVGFSLMIIAALGYFLCKHRPSFAATSTLAICASILCMPLAWCDYILFAFPFLMAKRWNWFTIGGAALLAVPFYFSSEESLYVVAVLLLTASAIWDVIQKPPPASIEHQEAL